MRIIFTSKAKDDLMAFKKYLKGNYPDKITKTQDEIDKYISQLLDYPNYGTKSFFAGTREFKLSKLPYKLIYKIERDVIYILRIYHTSRKPL
jgi:addiction module RelE/StbE family toxin